MEAVKDRQNTTNKTGGIVHIILPDSSAESGWRSFNIYVDDLQAGLQLISEKDLPGGYAGVDLTGKINPNLLPAIAITNTYVVTSQSEMLALSVTVGSVAVRTDQSKSYILQTEPSSVLGNWVELQGVSGVASFNGRTGTVIPQNNDYTTAQIQETSLRVFITQAEKDRLAALTGQDATAFHSDVNGEIHGLTDIGTIADATEFLAEKTSLFNKVKVTWSLIKSTLNTYFDTIYALSGHNHDATYEPKRTTGQNYVSDINLAVLNQTSGVNTGNQLADQDTIIGTGIGSDKFRVNSSIAGSHDANNISVDTTNFNNNLSSNDDTVQKALETLDELTASGTDTNAIHKTTAAEISTLTEKTDIVDDDIFLGENSENFFSKIKVKFLSFKAVLKTYFDGIYDSNYNIKYGRLYNWYVASDPLFAPVGWHVPTQAEFEALIAELGGDLVAGGKLKEVGLIYWDTPNTGATNESNFHGRGTGFRNYIGGIFQDIKVYGTLWSSTDSDSDNSWSLIISNVGADAILYDDDNNNGFPVRLLADNPNDWNNGDTIADIDGNIYRTVKIGNQVWLADNWA